MKNLAGIDLNLLLAFDALMAERNVTRAAACIGLAQPSMSNALSRLRALFADELFVRTPGQMRPTARARALFPHVSTALGEIRQIFENERPFDPAEAQAGVTLGAADYSEFVLLPHILACLRTEAPGIALRMRPFERARLYDQIDAGAIDLALGVFADPPKRISRATVLEETFVCIARRGHPALRDGLDMDVFLAQPQILVSPMGLARGPVDDRLAELGAERRVALSVGNFGSLPFLVARSDLIAVTPRRLALALSGPANIALHPLPFAMPGFELAMIWGGATAHDPAQVWVREMIGGICMGL